MHAQVVFALWFLTVEIIL